jgi:hypothetical protein
MSTAFSWAHASWDNAARLDIPHRGPRIGGMEMNVALLPRARE